VAVELVSAYGIRMDGVPDLTFGMSRAEVLDVLGPDRPVGAPFVCGPSWVCAWPGDGVTVQAWGGQDLLTGGFEVTRRSNEDEYEPVVFHGVDLFGFPSDEIVDCLRADGLRVNAGPQLVRVGSDLVLFHRPDSGRPGFLESALLTSGNFSGCFPEVVGGAPAA
jgi:hypothetical protein